MPQLIVLFAIVIVGAGLVALGVRAWIQLGEYRRVQRLGSPGQESPPADFQPMERYRPMARLLAGEDAEFLGRNTSCPKTAARWERSRRRVIRLYLKELAGDFHRLHAKARILVSQSPEQYAGLVPLLFKQQVVFWRTLVMIELRLSLGGLDLGKLNAENLIQSIQAIQQEISRAATANPA